MIQKKVKVKPLTIILILFTLIPVFTIAILTKTALKEKPKEPAHITEETLNTTIPVINNTVTMISPYTAMDVTIKKNYYDYQADEETQKNSIIVHDNTYIQNTGIDFTKEEVFDIIAVLEGTVISVKDDEALGKTIEIKHENGLITIYQSLSEVNIKKGDLVNQGQLIGKSGTNSLDKELGNHLHFEIYDNGQAVNPNNYLNKEISKKN